MIFFAGCAPSDPDNLPPLDADLAFGTPGQSRGQFGYPRCIDVDPNNKWVYVIDKSARVQRFDFDGNAQLQWDMPEKENGKPTGVSVGPNGHVYVADTHYFRVMEYDSEGRLVHSFGEHGEGPGQFIYVTDIAFGPNGNLYVAEYGGHDRVQVFSPDGTYLFEFGSFGTGEGGNGAGGELQFRRPQSLAFSRDGRELYIADACNHRIVVTDPKGQVLRTFASAGREPGRLCFPYSIEVLPDDTLLVCEFGNNRIQRFDRSGRSLGMYGRVGRGKGELQYPWAVAATDDRIFVLDSGNNRVQVIEPF
jgi:DNA-binding beta-propeller fold protein YncE